MTRSTMGYVEFAEISLDLLGIVLFVASVGFSMAFMLRRREKWRRWLPCVSIISLPFIELVPESGWSDVRSQWHVAVLGLVWSIWILFLVFFLLRTGKDALLISLRIAFTGMGILVFAGCVFALVESWAFLHSL
jgi:hypothetical protein